jgi:hypothetical protein
MSSEPKAKPWGRKTEDAAKPNVGMVIIVGCTTDGRPTLLGTFVKQHRIQVIGFRHPIELQLPRRGHSRGETR